MSLSLRISQFRIGSRIGAGFAVVLALLAAIIAVAWNGFGHLDNAFSLNATAADNAVRAESVDRDVAEIRRIVLAYLAGGDVDLWHKVDDLRHHSLDTLSAAMTTATDSVRRKQLQSVESLLNEYYADLDRLVPMRREREQRVTQEMDNQASRIRKEVAELLESAKANDDAAASIRISESLDRFMLAQIDGWRFLASGDHKHVDSAVSNLERARQAMQHASVVIRDPGQQKTARELPAQFDAYAEGIKHAAESVMALNRLVNQDSQRLVDQISELIAGMVSAQTTALTQTRFDAEAAIASARSTLIGAGSAAVVIGIILALAIARGISLPVKRMTKTMGALAQGDLEIEVPAKGYADEVGEMANAVEVFKRSMIEARELQAKEQDAIAARELRSQRLDRLASQFDVDVGTALRTVAAAAADLQGAAAQMADAADKTSDQAATVADGSRMVSANVASIASATDELTASASEIARSVSTSSKIAIDGAEQADQTDAAVEGLAEAVQQIGSVLKLINDVATRTHLLALNATIEAARAGNAGKGFAVVAAEVKNLATQSAKATGEISQIISGIRQASGGAVGSIRAIAHLLKEMKDISTMVATAVDQQGTATSEIARNLQQASDGAVGVSSNISVVNEMAGITGLAASKVLSASNDLAAQADTLRQRVDRFLEDVKAA